MNALKRKATCSQLTGKHTRPLVRPEARAVIAPVNASITV